MRNCLRRTLLAATILTGAEIGIGIAPAFAQIDTITVEARKREESLQDVPLAVTAFDEKLIERTYSDTLADFERYVPNVEFSDIQFSGQTLGASIRGVSFADLEKTFEPAVGVSVDGVFLGSNTGANIDVFDIEQIEVLRGPQGTLYGRNTVGGVINVRRTRPTGEAGLRAATRIGRHAQRDYMMVANTPQVGGVLSSKFYFFRNSDETYSENVVTGEPEEQADSIAYGGAFLFEPNDRLEALVSVDIFNDDSFGAPTYNLSIANGLPFGAGGNVCDFSLATGNGTNGCIDQSLDVAEANGFETHNRPFPFRNFIDGWSTTANASYELSENLTLTSVTGYRETSEQLFEDNLGGPNFVIPVVDDMGNVLAVDDIPFFIALRNQEYEQLSQELRIDGSIGDRFNFVSGLYYLNTDYSIRGGDGPEGLFGAPPQFGTAFILGGAVGNFTANQETNAYAVFADGTYDITDRLSFSGGFRYTLEEKDFDINFIATGVGEVSVSEDWTSPTGRAILQYELSDDAMIFGGWSRGFRSGGFNGRGTTPTSIGPYDPETVDSFEFGLRSEWLGRTLRVNPTGFYALYKDKQEEIIRAAPDGSGQTETIVENASEVTIWGLELEGLYQPIDALTIRAAAGYLNTEIDSFVIPDLTLLDNSSPNFDPNADPNNLPLVDVADTRALRRAPEFSVSVGGDYVRPVGDNMQMTFTSNYSWTDEFATSPVIDTVPGRTRHLIPADGSADFALTLETLNDDGINLALTGYVNDAFHDGQGKLGTTLDAGVFYFAAGVPTTVWGFEGVLTWQ